MKKIKIASLAAVAVLTVAGAANANTVVNFNAYGASAQFDFWNAAGQAYLTAKAGCTIVAAKTGKLGNYETIYGQNCATPPAPLPAGTTDIAIRYGSKASYSGIWALKNQADTTDAPGAAAFPGGYIAPATDPTKTCQDAANGSKGPNYRWFLDENTLTKGVCLPVTVAASDVEATAFSQLSIGLKQGPTDTTGGVAINRNFTAAGAVNAAGLSFKNPIIVPFGFYVNKAVAYNKCFGTSNPALIGNLCYQNSDCDGPSPTAGNGQCGPTSNGAVMDSNCSNANTIDNLTREQAVAIFSGSVTNWADFGQYYAAQPIVACLRHAGSGTHSTLDLEIMHKTWGQSTVNLEQQPADDYGVGEYQDPSHFPLNGNLATDNVIWFNDATGDELNCIKGAAVAGNWLQADGVTPNVAHTQSCIGAVGYADADKACAGGTAANVAPVKYNGNFPSREAIRNGRYDFFTDEWMYWDGAGDANVAAVTPDFDAWLNPVVFVSPDRITQYVGAVNACRATYWATHGEMVFNRTATSGFPNKSGTSKVKP
jgi:hypothetical protein